MNPENKKIAGIGAYIPRFRVSADEFRKELGRFKARGIEEKSVPNADEDSLTMAYEAAKRSLEVTNTKPEEIDFVAF
ncbi:MAG: ACP synthase, partial [Halobacteria archaeon]|nr:ACP synthase [Halobacteria archaeon]